MRRETGSFRRLVIGQGLKRRRSPQIRQNRSPSAGHLSHPFREGHVFCNDVSSIRASHFPVKLFHERHLDKKLHWIGQLQDADNSIVSGSQLIKERRVIYPLSDGACITEKALSCRWITQRCYKHGSRCSLSNP